MFTVYGVSGRVLSGSMDHLRQVGGVRGAARTKSLQTIARDGKGPGWATPTAQGDVGVPVSTDGAHRTALAAYAEVQEDAGERISQGQVADLMNVAVVTVHDTDMVGQAWQHMVAQGVSQAPVVNAQGILVGMFSGTQLLGAMPTSAFAEADRAWTMVMNQTVASLMRTPVPSTSDNTDVRRAARVLIETGLPGLAVVDAHGLVIGFISRTDILQVLATEVSLDLWG